MNERIEKLIAKSKLENLDGFAQYEVDAIYNLAELIVTECARIARNTNLEDVEGGDSAVLLAAKNHILDHFGVE